MVNVGEDDEQINLAVQAQIPLLRVRRLYENIVVLYAQVFVYDGRPPIGDGKMMF